MIINGKLKSVGKVPPRTTLKKWLMETRNAEK
jgi:hypothetical protein